MIICGGCKGQYDRYKNRNVWPGLRAFASIYFKLTILKYDGVIYVFIIYIKETSKAENLYLNCNMYSLLNIVSFACAEF